MALARCVYAAPKLALLDDPLSALDAATAAACVDALFGEGGALAGAATLLVTHAAHVLRRADRIVCLDAAGDVAFDGTWPEAERAASETPDDPALAPLVAARARGLSRDDVEVDVEGEDPRTALETKKLDRDGSLMTEERRQEGYASASTWWTWARAAGGAKFLFLQFLCLALDRACGAARKTSPSRQDSMVASPSRQARRFASPSRQARPDHRPGKSNVASPSCHILTARAPPRGMRRRRLAAAPRGAGRRLAAAARGQSGPMVDSRAQELRRDGVVAREVGGRAAPARGRLRNDVSGAERRRFRGALALGARLLCLRGAEHRFLWASDAVGF